MPSQETDLLETAQFRACAGDSQGIDATPGEALNDLMTHLNGSLSTPIVIWPYHRGDAYFTVDQHRRLAELQARSSALTNLEQEEMERLVEAEFDATISRTQPLQNGAFGSLSLSFGSPKA